MENNNAKMIRHFINLMESVNNKILVDTLQNKENTLEEQIATANKLLGNLRGLANADEIARNAATVSGIKGINTYDDLVKGLGTTISNAKATQIVKNLIRQSPELKNTFRAELMTTDDFIRGAQEVYPNGVSGQLNASKEAIVMKTLKTYGYTDDEARSIIKTTAERAGRIQPNRLAGPRLWGSIGGTKKPNKTEIAVEAAKAADAIPPETAKVIKQSRFKRLSDGTKQFVWNQKWGIVTGAAIVGAWWLLSNGGKEEVKIVKPDGEDITPVAPSLGAKRSKYIPSGKADCVIRIQTFLKGQGFSLGPKDIDGVYGPYTIRAVQEYQRKNDLTPDGIWGPLTAAKTGNQVLPCGVTQTTTDSSSTPPNNIKNQADSLVNLDKTQYPGIYGTDVSQFNVQ